MSDFQRSPSRDGYLYALTALGLVGLGAIWELRWRRLAQELTRRDAHANDWVERALHDPLTNLPNRTLLSDRIEQALIRAQRNETRVAALFIDLDNFKEVNDRHGHLVGDQLLIAVGDRFRSNLRASDTAARLGGDEFVVLIDISATDPADTAHIVAERLRRALQVPLVLDPEPLTVNASIGIAISENGDDQPDDLLHQADRALLSAKQAGKNQTILAPQPNVEPVASRQTR